MKNIILLRPTLWAGEKRPRPKGTVLEVSDETANEYEALGIAMIVGAVEATPPTTEKISDKSTSSEPDSKAEGGTSVAESGSDATEEGSSDSGREGERDDKPKRPRRPSI